jgi:NitT/TauT family transport system permease protein
MNTTTSCVGGHTESSSSHAAMSTTGPRRSNAAWLGALAGLMPALLLSIVLLVVWEAISRIFRLPEFVLPAPSSIVHLLLTKQASLSVAARVTAEEILYGFVLSTLVGMAIAITIARFEVMGRAVYPLMVLFQNVPKIALAPLFILWFGYDLTPKIVLIVVMAFFPVALNMLVGLRSTDPNLVTLLRTVGASETEILLRAQIPNSLPYLMSGIKIAITLSVIGAIVGEFAGASAGLGYMIQFASTQMETALVFAALIEISVLGMIFYYAIEYLEWKYLAWDSKL